MANELQPPNLLSTMLQRAERIGPDPTFDQPVMESGVPSPKNLSPAILKILATAKQGLPEFQEINRYIPTMGPANTGPNTIKSVDHGSELFKRLLERFGGRGGM